MKKEIEKKLNNNCQQSAISHQQSIINHQSSTLRPWRLGEKHITQKTSARKNPRKDAKNAKIIIHGIKVNCQL